MDVLLTEIECRVLGSLIEKELTTPEYYPLSLNALVNACNQKSNRTPVMELGDAQVLQAVDGLKGKRLAWERHDFIEKCGWYKHFVYEVVSWI